MTNNAFARPASKFGRPRSGPVPVAQPRAAAVPTDTKDDTDIPPQGESRAVEETSDSETSAEPETSASVDSEAKVDPSVDAATPEPGTTPESGVSGAVKPDPLPAPVSTPEPSPTSEPGTPEPGKRDPAPTSEDSQQVKSGTKRTTRTNNRPRKDVAPPNAIPLVVISEGTAATSDEVHILDLDKTTDLDDVDLLEIVRGLRPVADSELKTKTVRTLMAMIEQKALADG